jgi:alpha-glucosidase (family GH31 glycosyl hydrolase)
LQRYTWHDYVMAQMAAVSQTGKPVNRPLWFDFPNDPLTWDVTTSYMFGDTMLVAPVTDAGVTEQTA